MKKAIKILVLIVISLLPIPFSLTIPYVRSSRLQLDTNKGLESNWQSIPNIYVISLEQGQTYTISVQAYLPDTNAEILLKIGDTPYSISGYQFDSLSSPNVLLHFTASRTGEYYIQVSCSRSFNIRIDLGRLYTQLRGMTEFFDISYLLVVILPTFIILLGGIIGFLYKLKTKSPTEKLPQVDFEKIEIYQQNSSENIISIEEVAETNEINQLSSSKDVVSIEEVEKILVEEKLEEQRQIEEDVGVEAQKFMCIVHKGAIEGANLYLCPYCHTLYCVRCATVLKEKNEKCWVCKSEITI